MCLHLHTSAHSRRHAQKHLGRTDLVDVFEVQLILGCCEDKAGQAVCRAHVWGGHEGLQVSHTLQASKKTHPISVTVMVHANCVKTCCSRHNTAGFTMRQGGGGLLAHLFITDKRQHAPGPGKLAGGAI
eukprot:1158015-Pelagomonas_calceolata.AAC.7